MREKRSIILVHTEISFADPSGSPVGLLKGSPIVTISLGEERVFRFRPWRGKGYQDFVVKEGSVVIIPWDTNKTWTHEVPHFVRFKKRRISVTLRVYEEK
jgi:hypothetical protein